MKKGIDVVMNSSFLLLLLLLENLNGRMKSERMEFLRSQHINHVGQFLRDANREELVYLVIQT